MMGRTHALSGAVGYLAAAPVLAHAGVPATGWPLALGTIAAAGAALLPDLDHPSGTAARALGPVTRLLAAAVSAVTGHRGATHSLLGIAAAVLLAFAATVHAATAGVLLWLLAGLGVQGLRVVHRRHEGTIALVAATGAAGVALGLVSMGVDLSVLPWAVGIGCLAHILGDAATETGVPLLWPCRARLRIASIDTNSKVERYLVVPALWAAAAVLTVQACELDPAQIISSAWATS